MIAPSKRMALACLAALWFAALDAFADSKTPPPGPPWKRDLLDAQSEALRTGKPIFLYFTKTY
jgi:hypothetical protein